MIFFVVSGDRFLLLVFSMDVFEWILVGVGEIILLVEDSEDVWLFVEVYL